MQSDELAKGLEALHLDAFGWALACCRGDAEAAQEAVQVAYVKALDGAARFDGRSSLKTWLFGVIRRTAGEQRRARRLAIIGVARLVARAPRPVAPDPEADARCSEVAWLLRRALARLSRRQAEVLHLVFYQGMTVEEAAVVLGVSAGTARLHYARGKRRLRRLLPEGVSS
jgi:RNA polymerase sigma-70 factor (ECF subfamily)